MYNGYALITGASEGLGKCLALECASRGMNLVLVALPGSGLPHLAHYIGNTWHVEALCIETDLAAAGACQRIYDDVKARGIRVNMLINNAGMGGTFFFGEREAAYYDKQISLNVLAPTLLCRLFLEDLKAGGRAHILNVSSLAGLFHLPKKQVYSGTKSYLITFTRSLRSELQGTGVSVSVLCPGGMNTQWQLTVSNCTTGTWLSRRSVMEPQAVAQRAFTAMLQGKEVIVPGFLNRVFLLMDKVFPGVVKNALVRLQLRKSTGEQPALKGGRVRILAEAPEFTYTKSALPKTHQHSPCHGAVIKGRYISRFAGVMAVAQALLMVFILHMYFYLLAGGSAVVVSYCSMLPILRHKMDHNMCGRPVRDHNGTSFNPCLSSRVSRHSHLFCASPQQPLFSPRFIDFYCSNPGALTGRRIGPI